METARPGDTYKTDLTLLHDLAALHDLHIQFLVKGEGPAHDQTFHGELRVGSLVGFGSGSSKQKAKIEAAKKVVEDLKKLPVREGVTPYWSKRRTDLVDPVERPYYFYRKNPVSALVEILNVRRQSAPEFRCVSLEQTDMFNTSCCVEVKVGKVSCTAKASSKKEAKCMAAERMLEMMGFKKLMQMHNPKMKPSEEQWFHHRVLQEQEAHKHKVLRGFKEPLKPDRSENSSADIKVDLSKSSSVSVNSRESPSAALSSPQDVTTMDPVVDPVSPENIKPVTPTAEEDQTEEIVKLVATFSEFVSSPPSPEDLIPSEKYMDPMSLTSAALFTAERGL